jgi:tetraacyldisaccharide 4'-kinase
VFILLRIIGILFFPLLWLYTLIIYLRNKFYDWGWFKSYSVDAPVISVGNIQLGGTGKTPLVEYISRMLMENGKSVAILSRGYRRKGKEGIIVEGDANLEINPDMVGDEPYLLKQNLPGVILGVDASRLRVAREILKRRNDVTFVLDDGFQHRRLRRDLDIVLIDVSRWSKFPLLFPLTQFRDVKSSLTRAGLIILNRTQGLEKIVQDLKKDLGHWYKVPILTAQIKPESLQSVSSGGILSLKALQNKKVSAFCGLANPDQFFKMMGAIGAAIVWQKTFPDHHDYTEKELSEILEQSREAGAELIVTTQKDAVKITGKLHSSVQNIYFLKIFLDLHPGDQLDLMLK